MASQSQKDTLPIAVVFSNLFRNLPRLMLTNLLFAVPLGAFLALFWYLTTVLPLSDMQASMMILLTIILVFPFYAGVVKVTAKISTGEEKVAVIKNYFSAVKDNFLRFLVHGVVLYVVVVLSVVSVNIYLNLIKENSIFIGPLIISIIIMIIFLFIFFYIPAMTVTFDIPMRYIYKNSFLMSYGEIKNNFIGLIGLFLLLAFSSTLLIACQGSYIAVIIVTVVLAALFVPAIAAFIINSAVYSRMYEMITDKSARNQEIDAKIDSKLNERKKPAPSVDREEYLRSVRDFQIDESLPDDEYIYFNGKMMKKSVLMKLKREAELSVKD